MDKHSRPRSTLRSERRSLARRLRIESLEDRRMLATFSVSNLSDAGTGSLRQAIIDANNQGGADDIDFSGIDFTSPQTISLASALPTIIDSVTIAGPGRDLLTLDAGHGTDNLPGTGDGFRLFDINDGSSNLSEIAISDLTLTGGDVTGEGGAIRSRENLTITQAAILANATGPGESGNLGDPGQDSGRGGGIYSIGGNLTITNSTISGNSTGNGGDGGNGADGANGQPGGDGKNGGTGGDGGGIFSEGGNLTVTNSTLSGNSTGSGGLSGSAGNGGINGAGGRGGDGGYGGRGGGIYISDVGYGNMVTITGSTISGNITGVGRDGADGGIGGSGADDGNGGDGGNGGHGGGIYSLYGPLNITMSTLTGNQASSGGSHGDSGYGYGGLQGIDGIDGIGGGVNSLANSPVLITSTIIAANQASGAAPDLMTGSVTLNIDYSLIGDGDGLQISAGNDNQIGTALAPINPQLGPLAKNGGPTQTHALLPSSPAIDACDPSILPNVGEFDQRGTPFRRVEDGDLVVGTTIDIGAYEAQAPPSADFDQDSDVDGADFLTWQRNFGTISDALPSDGNSDDDEDVDASDLAVWKSSFGNGLTALQALQTVPAAPPATPTTAVVLDLALATFGQAANENQPTETTTSASLSAEIHASAFAELAPAAVAHASPADSLATSSSIEDDSATIETQLDDELLTTLL